MDRYDFQQALEAALAKQQETTFFEAFIYLVIAIASLIVLIRFFQMSSNIKRIKTILTVTHGANHYFHEGLMLLNIGEKESALLNLKKAKYRYENIEKYYEDGNDKTWVRIENIDMMIKKIEYNN